MTFRSAGAGVTGSGTSIVVPVPAGVAVDDIITIGVYTENGTDATFTWPSGFTVKHDSGTTSATTRGRLQVAWKRATAADTGTYTVTMTTSGPFEAVAMAYSGIWKTGDPFDQIGVSTSASNTTTTNTPGSFTPVPSLSDLVGYCTNHASDAGAWTHPTGMTERYDNSASPPAHLTATSEDSVTRAAVSRTFTLSGITGGTFPRGFIGGLIRDHVWVRDSVNTAPAGTASFTLTLPTHVTGDRLTCVVMGKYETASTPTINQGWTLEKFATGGTGTAGADVGQMFVAEFAKIATSSSETAPVITAGATAPNTWQATCYAYAPPPGRVWRDAIALNPDHVQTVSDTVTTSPLTGAVTFTNQPQSGDAVIAVGGVPTDTGQSTGGTYTVTGVGIAGGYTDPKIYTENALGDDCAICATSIFDFTGPATGSFTVTFIPSSTNNFAGVIAVIALRLADPVSATVNAVTPTASGAMLAPTVSGETGTGDAEVEAVVMTGSGAMNPPAVGVSTFSVTATGSGAMGVPSVTGNGSVAGVTATGSGAMPAPAVTGGVTLNPPAAVGTGQFLPPVVQTSASVDAVVMTGSGEFLPPVFQTSASGEVLANAGTGSGEFLPPVVQGENSATVNAVVMEGSGEFLPPELSATTSATIQAVAMVGVAQFSSPALTADASVTAVPMAGFGVMGITEQSASAVVGAVVAVASGEALNPVIGTGVTVEPPVMTATGRMRPPYFIDPLAPPDPGRTHRVPAEPREYRVDRESRRYRVAEESRIYEVGVTKC